MLETSKEYNTTILQGNDELARDGFEVSKFFINTYLHSVYPRFPEEWITILNNHLLSSQELAFIGAHLGIKDLILYSDYKDNRIESKLKIISGPPSLDIISTALMALIGALAKEQIERAHLFVKDFILVRLVDYDLNELFHIPNPFELLAGILASEGRGPPESRLQNQCGMNTILACYQVGIYSDRGLIGEAPGETISIAEDEAARQAIRSYFGLTEDRPPLIFGSSQIHDQNNLNVPGNPKVSIESYLNRKSSMETS